MKKIITIISLFICMLIPNIVWAQDTTHKQTRKEAIKTYWNEHFKLYGFIRNYFTYDSRESMSGTGDLYNYQPRDRNLNALGEDLNAISTFRFLTLTTRVGLNMFGYQWGKTEFGAKIEADFYTGLSGVGNNTHKLSGVAQLRLRQAFLTLAWDSLRMGQDIARVDLLMGQAWHPMAADLPDVIALNSGAPFGPFSRTPQVKMDARLGKYVTLTGAFIWQMQYNSIGPNGQSAEYIAYSKTPESYLGLSVHDKGFLMRVGADILSIRPRHLGNLDGTTVKVSDRITTISPFVYLQYKKGALAIKAKSIFAQAGEHMNMNGGYGVSAVHSDGSWSYTPTRTSSSWLSISYGGKIGPQDSKYPHKLQGILFAGYIHNMGTIQPLIDADGDGKLDYYYPRANNMRQMARLTPTILWTIGPFQLGCEYELTTVKYGDNIDTHGLATTNLHWVTNHRVQLMTKFNF